MLDYSTKNNRTIKEPAEFYKLLHDTVGGSLVSQQTFAGSGIEPDILAGRFMSMVVAKLPHPRKAKMTTIMCGGQDEDKELAELKALMEFAERYAFTHGTIEACRPHQHRPLDITPLRAQLHNTIRSYALWDTIFDECAVGYTLIGEQVCVPRSLACGVGGARVPVLPTSNGMAAHVTTQHAIENATLELIERDACMRFWLAPESAKVLKQDDAQRERGERLHQALITTGVNSKSTLTLMQLESYAGVPVVIALLSARNEDEAPALLLGSGAAYDAHHALEKAMAELEVATLNLIARHLHTPTWAQQIPSWDSDMNPKEHSEFYHHPAIRKKLSFLTVLTSQFPQEIQTKQNYDPLPVVTVDMTPPFLAGQISVVRCIAPELSPFAFGFPLPHDTKRASAHSVAAQVPHPFP